MDFFFSTKISIPLFQILLLLIFSTTVLLYGKVRLALVINYIFTLYWGYVFNREYLRGFGYYKIDAYSLVYLAFGLVIVLLVFVGFTAQREQPLPTPNCLNPRPLTPLYHPQNSEIRENNYILCDFFLDTQYEVLYIPLQNVLLSKLTSIQKRSVMREDVLKLPKQSLQRVRYVPLEAFLLYFQKYPNGLWLEVERERIHPGHNCLKI